MKRFILLISFIPYLVIGQNFDKFNEIYKKSKLFYKSLNNDSMKTDLLFNYGFIILDEPENAFNKKPIFAEQEKWWRIYNSIQNSSLDNKNKLPNRIEIEKNIGDVSLSVLFCEGDYIPFIDVCKKITNKDYSVNYKQIKIHTGTVHTSKNLTQNIKFEYNKNLFISNINSKIDLEINFNDGIGYRKCDIFQNKSFFINYETIGEKSVSYRIINEKDTFISYSKIVITESINKNIVDNNWVTGTHTYGTGKIEYAYSQGCDGQLNKPVFISEGFDVDGTYTITALKKRWASNTDGDDIVGRLNAYGYDVYLINYLTPDKSIQTNASCVSDFIRNKVNIEKQGNFEGIYIGESMGGIIGRVAIREMEIEYPDYDHQIGLYVSFDSPHKGADIPLGLQILAEDIMLHNGFDGVATVTDILEDVLGNDIPFADYYSMLNSMSAKQLLIRHRSAKNEEFSSSFKTFQTYLDLIGYPENSRNIAIANGSNIGTSQGVTSEYVLYYNPNITYSLLPPYTFTFSFNAKFPTSGNSGSDNVSNIGMYFKSIHTTTWTETEYVIISFFLGFPIWAARDVVHTVEELLPDFNLGLSRYVERHPITYYNTAGGKKGFGFSYDVPLGFQLPFESNEFSFVPTLSAIGYNGIIYNDNDYNTLYNQNGLKNTNYLIEHGYTPFDDIYSDSDNFIHPQHMDFKMQTSFEEMEVMYKNMYLQDRIIVNNRDFQSKIKLEAGNNVTFLEDEIDEDSGELHTKHIKQGEVRIKSGTTVNFTAGEAIDLKDGFTVENGADFTASIAPICGGAKNYEPAISTVYPPQIIGSKYFCGEATYTTNSKKHNVEWNLIGENTNISVLGETFKTPENLAYGQYTLYCTKNTDNGSATISKVIRTKCPQNFSKTDTIYTKLYNNKNSIEVYPNPTKGDITIASTNQIITHIAISNISGSILLQEQVNSMQTQINISHLQQGFYFVKITTETGESITQKIVKE